MSSNNSTGNRRIARNALFLYLRMGLSMVVSLYTSRILLQALGIMDYGLWNVVAGVIVMFGFLNASMSGCTNRFISYELGNGDQQSLQRVFSASLTIHLLIAAVVLLLGETVGVWFLENKLVIPGERLWACRIIYQLSILSTILGITQVPYNATIMAHEKMNVYAYIEIGNILSRLLIVYLILALPFDRLVTYGALSTAVSISIMAIYRFYCVHYMSSCRFRLSRDWTRMKPMLIFSCWDLYGNASVMARTQGVNMLLNMFFTAVMNAASAVGSHVQGAVMAFGWNVVGAFRPQIVKSYAAGDLDRMCWLIRKATTYTMVLLLFLMLPLIVEMQYVLELWLKEAPDYAAPFSTMILLFSLISTASSIVMIGIHATGHIKQPSFLNGTIYLLVVPFSYVVFRLGWGPEWPFLFNIGAVIIGYLLNVFLLHRLAPTFSAWGLLRQIVVKLVLSAVVVFAAGLLVSGLLEASFIRLLLVVLTTSILMALLSYFFIFDAHDRRFVIEKGRKILLPFISRER